MKLRVNFLLTLTLLSLSSITHAASAENNDIQLTSMWYHSCILVNQEVDCWGRSDDGQTNVPPLKNPRVVSAGGFHTCALDDNGVKCWGSNKYGQTNVPPLKNPRAVSPGAYHTCALDDNGVKCWGVSAGGQTNVPPLRNPRAVSAGTYHTCALDDNGVKCWGFSAGGQTNVPPLRNPRAVSSGAYHTCALDENGVKCWGSNKYGQTNVPPLKNPRVVSLGIQHTCALDENGVNCWGFSDYGRTNVPPLKNPRAVSAGGYHTCAVDDNGVKCWGNNIYGQGSVPNSVQEKINLSNIQVTFELASLEKSFLKLSKFVYRYKERFFKGLAAELEKIPLTNSLPMAVQYRIALSRYTFFELAGSIIESTHSELIEKGTLPNYQAYLEVLRKQMGISSLESVELVEPVFKALLSTSILAIQSSKDFLLIEEEAREQDQMLLELGNLSTSLASTGYNPLLAKELLAILNKHHTLIASMSENPKIDGFSAVLGKITTYLKGKN